MRKDLKSEAEGREFSKFLRYKTIDSNNESSEQFLVTECFFSLVHGCFLSKTTKIKSPFKK